MQLHLCIENKFLIKNLYIHRVIYITKPRKVDGRQFGDIPNNRQADKHIGNTIMADGDRNAMFGSMYPNNNSSMHNTGTMFVYLFGKILNLLIYFLVFVLAITTR